MSTYSMDFIVDVTASNEKNLPCIYYFVEEVVNEFLQYKTDDKFVFGMTTLKGGSESGEALTFAGGEDFTSDVKDLLVSFMEVKTTRGSLDAVESIDEAMKISLSKFQRNKGYLGIPILITDCALIPEGKNCFDYIDEVPVFHMFGFCSQNFLFRMRFINSQGVEQSMEQISIKDYEQLANEDAVRFLYDTIVTHITKNTVGN